MSRLADLMLAGAFSIPTPLGPLSSESSEDLTATVATVQGALRTCPVIIADNVADFYYAGTDQEVWHIARDFPCLAPPFPEFWIEWRPPAQIVSSVAGVVSSRGRVPIRTGCFVQSRERNEGGWALAVVTWAMVDPGVLLGPYGVTYFLVEEDGTVIDHQDQSKITRQRIFMSAEEQELVAAGAVPPRVASTAAFLSVLHFPGLLTISFLHCKNTRLVESVVPPKVARKRAKHGRAPLVTWHTLEIGPIKTLLEGEGNLQSNGLKKALHICRGHFATYSADRPLFGRMAGTFWVPAHLRGSRQSGIALKQYEVKRP